MKIKTTKDLRTALRTPYAWPGGYKTFLLTTDGGCLHIECAKKHYREISSSLKDGTTWSGWHPDALDVNLESELFCDQCGELIESSYGVDEVEKAKHSTELAVQGGLRLSFAPA